MDKEQINIQFEKIERRIERLLSKISSLEASNLELMQENERLASDLRQEQESGQKYVEERDQIKLRIDGLLSRLDNFVEPN